MRGLFLLLLLTNIAFVVWQLVVSENEQARIDRIAAVPSVKEGLTLLSELPPGQLPALREEVNEKGSPPKADNIQLQQELSAETPNSQENPDRSHQSTDSEDGICLNMANIESESVVQGLLALLRESRATLVTKGAMQATKTNYWVMLAPYSSRSKADEAAAILGARKVKDFFIVRSGEYANAVSLGVFSEHSRAKRRYNEIIALKARLRKPKIEPIELPAKRYFVNFRIDKAAAWTSLSRRLQASGYPPARKVSCK